METITDTKHIKVLGRGDPRLLGDAALVRQFVTDLVRRVGMEPLGEPVIHDVPQEIQKLGREPFEDEGGVTAQLVGFHTLSTSHVAIHTWPLRKEFHLDLYSCRVFDREDVLGFVTEVFHTDEMRAADLTPYCEWEPQS
jgi:S-adenosylmethionine/arginine decarboxylase-like enzyme